MDKNDWSIRSVALPKASRAAAFHARIDFADAFAVRLPDNATDDPEQLARFIFTHQPAWIGWLMKVRDTLVASFGLKTTRQLREVPASQQSKRVGIFRIYDTHAHEIVLGEDDSHLDFRVSVLTQPAVAADGRLLVVSTVVHCHNLLGRSYIALIAPFHRRVVRASLRHAARTGWPARAGGA